MPIQKVLITGVYGLIGSVVYDRLVAQPDAYEVYGLARRRHPSDRVAPDKRIEIPDERFTLSDLSDMAVLEAALTGIDAVVHMAADPNLEAGWESILASNLIGPDAGGNYGFGHSMILTPIAWRLAQARGTEEIIAAKLDPDPLRYITWGSKSLQNFDHLEDRNLELYEEILKEARARFEPGIRFPRKQD